MYFCLTLCSLSVKGCLCTWVIKIDAPNPLDHRGSPPLLSQSLVERLWRSLSVVLSQPALTDPLCVWGGGRACGGF